MILYPLFFRLLACSDLGVCFRLDLSGPFRLLSLNFRIVLSFPIVDNIAFILLVIELAASYDGRWR